MSHGFHLLNHGTIGISDWLHIPDSSLEVPLLLYVTNSIIVFFTYVMTLVKSFGIVLLLNTSILLQL